MRARGRAEGIKPVPAINQLAIHQLAIHQLAIHQPAINQPAIDKPAIDKLKQCLLIGNGFATSSPS